MKQTRLLMGMPITVEIVDAAADVAAFDEVYAFFSYVDETFSPFKETSEVSRINRNELKLEDACDDMRIIMELAEETRQDTFGYFDVWHNGRFNPSGVVKGWAIDEAANLLYRKGFRNFYVDAGGDVQVYGLNAEARPWRIGIRNPFNRRQVVKTVSMTEGGIATSGLYIRGRHIYNPHNDDDPMEEIVSMTVVGVDVLEADRLATAAFVMGVDGIQFIEFTPNVEGYMINRHGQATQTSGFATFLTHA